MTGDAQADRLGACVRTILNLRLFAVTLTLLYLPTMTESRTAPAVALLASLACSFVPLVAWPRISASVLRHPSWLAVDLLLSIAVLALAGPESPFLLATLGTAALAGILYGIPGAAVFTGLLLLGWATVLHLRPDGADGLAAYQALVTLPALYPLCAAGGAAVRRLIDEQVHTEMLLLAAEHASSTSAERARVARELHDSVGKSLYGIALSASALASRAQRHPDDAAGAAKQIAAAANVAAVEARELIGDLRADDLRDALHETLATAAHAWARSTDVKLQLDLHPVDADVDVRYEALAIANEALRNVERHAGATMVRVGLDAAGHQIRLTIADDGRGLPSGHDTDELVAMGHYGLLGMRERAQRLGGTLDIGPNGAAGLALTALLPAAGGAPPPTPEARPARRRLGLQGTRR